MMLDGKMVLPLIWRELPPTAEGKPQFSLSILLELFSFATEQRYQPMEAMSPYTIGIEERGNTPEQGTVSVQTYFGQLAHTLATACSRRLQSGFVLQWSQRCGGYQATNITLATVDQNWRYSESATSASRFDQPKPRGIDLKLAKLAEVAARTTDSRPADFSDAEDAFDWGDRWSAIEAHYPRSTLSIDLLEQARIPAVEDQLARNPATFSLFHYEARENLWAFLKDLEAMGDNVFLRGFIPFGELSEFVGSQEFDQIYEVYDALAAFDAKKSE
jgi:hypothetical protein